MKKNRLGLALLVAVLAACDPAATTGVRLRPLGETGTRSSKQIALALPSVQIVLESFGFEKKTYPTDVRQKILAECGFADYWLMSSRDATGSFGTYARVCLSDGVVHLSISDWGRFSLSEPTKALRDRIAQSLRETLSGVEVSVE